MKSRDKYIAHLRSLGWDDEKIDRAQEIERQNKSFIKMYSNEPAFPAELSKSSLFVRSIVRAAISYQNQIALIEKYGYVPSRFTGHVSIEEFRRRCVSCWGAAIGNGLVIC